MAETPQAEPAIPQIAMSNTKQEMLAAYKEVVKRLKEKRETELKPQVRVEEKRREEAIQAADSLSTEGIAREVGNLRAEIGKVLVELSDRMEGEIGKYLHVKRAVEAKETELKEIFEIEKEALSLAALLDAQKERRERVDAELSEKRQSLGPRSQRPVRRGRQSRRPTRRRSRPERRLRRRSASARRRSTRMPLSGRSD